MFAGTPTNVFSFTKQESKEPVFEKQSSLRGQVAPKSVIKLNLLPLSLGDFSFQYEYAFHKNMSGALGFSLLNLSGKLKAALIDSMGITNSKVTGWALTPEFRFYPGEKKENEAPHGFYLAPYFRYAKYNVTGLYPVDLPATAGSGGTPTTTPSGSTVPTESFNLNIKSTLTSYNAGLMIGYQWIIGGHFSLDWWILGMGRGKSNLTYDFYSSQLNMSASDQADLKKDMDENINSDSFSPFSPTVTNSTNAQGGKVLVEGLPSISLRSGLTIGFAF
jgi:hypothetical protein